MVRKSKREGIYVQVWKKVKVLVSGVNKENF